MVKEKKFCLGLLGGGARRCATAHGLAPHGRAGLYARGLKPLVRAARRAAAWRLSPQELSPRAAAGLVGLPAPEVKAIAHG
jgi:hypothetical protein